MMSGGEEVRPGYEVWNIDDDIAAVKRAIELMTEQKETEGRVVGAITK